MSGVRRCGQALVLAPVVGITAFLFLYGYAASAYPGGTKLDPRTVGYSHLDNYWCDLLVPVAYNGQPNPGMVYAVIGTVLLPLTLTAFWLSLPSLFANQRRKSQWVRWTGCASMSLATLVYTPMHDSIITVSGLLGLIAFAVATVALAQAKETTLFSLAIVAYIFAFADLVMWRGGVMLAYLPIIQKFAFVSFFVWVVACGIGLNRKLNLG